MTAKVISLEDERAKRLVARLLDLQTQIDTAARKLLAGQRVEDRLEDLLDNVEEVIGQLDQLAFRLTDTFLRRAIRATTLAHMSWSRARLGSEEERTAAAKYLESVDALAKVTRSLG